MAPNRERTDTAMGRILSLAVILLLTVSHAYAQKYPRNIDELPSVFTVAHSCTVTSASCVWTVQQPASNAKRLAILGFSIYCSAACIITQERNGSPASGSLITPVNVNPDWPASATFTAHHSSSSAGGSSIGGVIYVAAGTTVSVDTEMMFIIGAGTTRNFTIRTNSFTGTAQIVIKLEQY